MFYYYHPLSPGSADWKHNGATEELIHTEDSMSESECKYFKK